MSANPKSIRWKQESLQTIFIVMEASWLAAVFLFLESWAPQPGQLSLAWACLLYPLAYGLARITRYANWRPKWEAVFIVPLALLALALAVKLLLPVDVERLTAGETLSYSMKRLIFILFGGCFVWSRGWYLARRQLDLLNFAFSFQLGIYILLVIALFSGFVDLPHHAVADLMIVFFVTGLVGLWFARTQQAHGTSGASTLPPWLIMVTVALGLVLLASLLAQAMVDRNLLELAYQGLAWVVRQLARLFAYLMSLLPGSTPVEIPPNPLAIPGGGAHEAKISEKYLAFAKWRKIIAEIVFTVSWVSLFSILLFQNMRRLMQWLLKKGGATSGVLYEASEIGFFDDIRILLRTLAGWLARMFRKLRGKVRTGKRLSPEAESMRDTYRRLLAWAAARGRPMAPGQTPYEYLDTLSPWLPGKEEDLRIITESYVLARYGPNGADIGRVKTMRECWSRVKSSRLVKVKKKKKESNSSAARKS